jgi:hypothetical protein
LSYFAVAFANAAALIWSYRFCLAILLSPSPQSAFLLLTQFPCPRPSIGHRLLRVGIHCQDVPQPIPLRRSPRHASRCAQRFGRSSETRRSRDNYINNSGGSIGNLTGAVRRGCNRRRLSVYRHLEGHSGSKILKLFAI